MHVQVHIQLQHKHVVTLYDFFEDAERVYLVMELCSGGSLLQRVQQQGRLSEKQARQYLQQLVQAVGYLHSHAVLHRDIKV